jgi:hypothetical protein
MLYEREFVANYSPLPLIVYDFQVLAHDIHKRIETYEYATNADPLLFTQMLKAAWAYRLNYGIDTTNEPLEKFTAIVVNDCKGEVPLDCSEFGTGYWRHIVAKELGLQEYKLGRATKPDSFNLVCQIGLSYIHSKNSTFYYYEQPYMEADDLAGKLARLKRKADPQSVGAQRQMLLYTVDGDWQGLVSDKHHIIWCNIGPWLPRMRNGAGVIDYYFRKTGSRINDARECYDLKSELGDLGDGLVAGSPLRLFDLYNEDHQYSFSEEASDYLKNVLHSMKNSKKIEHLKSSEKFFKKFGVVPPILGYASQEEFEFFEEKSKIERQNAKLKGTSPTMRKICKSVETLKAENLKKCLEIGKKDEYVRTELKKTELGLESCPKLDRICINSHKKTIKDLKDLRKTLKNEAESLTSD